MKTSNGKAIGVLVNDLHLNKDNGSLVKDIIRQVIDTCREWGVNRIFCGGDVFTNRSGQPLSCLTDWKEILETLGREEIELHVIPGNHDKTDKDSRSSYLDIYSDPCLRLYTSARTVRIDGVVVGFVPYFGDERWLAEYERIGAEARKGESSILITHMGFDGVRNNDGTRVESLLKPNMFKHWTAVLVGHYHNASVLSRNVCYTGSAYQGTFGETAEDKGCTVILRDGTLRHVPLHFPRFIREDVDVNDKETLRNLMERYGGETYDHIRIVFHGKRAEASLVDVGRLSAMGIDAQFQAEETDEAIGRATDERALLSYDRKEIMKDFVRFCSENNIRGEHLRYGMSLIRAI